MVATNTAGNATTTDQRTVIGVFEDANSATQALIVLRDAGFTPEQVQMALGEPDHTFTRTTEKGMDEVWAYRDRKPRISIGLGVVGGGGSTRVGGATVVNSGGPYYDDVLRVVFEGGRVAAVEKVTR